MVLIADLFDQVLHMSDHIDQLISDATAKLREQEKAVADTKKFINQVCQFAGRPPAYSDAELVVEDGGSVSFVVTRNAFYGKPLAKCVREFLKGRERGATKEATLEEIMEALRAGSYDLESVSKDKDGQKRGVAISLAKNSQAFHRLPNGDWGLTEWYPNIRAKRDKANGGKSDPPVAAEKEESGPSDVNEEGEGDSEDNQMNMEEDVPM